MLACTAPDGDVCDGSTYIHDVLAASDMILKFAFGPGYYTVVQILVHLQYIIVMQPTLDQQARA